MVNQSRIVNLLGCLWMHPLCWVQFVCLFVLLLCNWMGWVGPILECKGLVYTGCLVGNTWQKWTWSCCHYISYWHSWTAALGVVWSVREKSTTPSYICPCKQWCKSIGIWGTVINAGVGTQVCALCKICFSIRDLLLLIDASLNGW